MYWPLPHMVVPAEHALQCQDCHGENGRMDWEALGYYGDPMLWGGRQGASATGEGGGSVPAGVFPAAAAWPPAFLRAAGGGRQGGGGAAPAPPLHPDFALLDEE